MDEATKTEYRDLKYRAAAMRDIAAKRPHLSDTLNKQAKRLEAEMDAFRRKHLELDNDDASSGD